MLQLVGGVSWTLLPPGGSPSIFPFLVMWLLENGSLSDPSSVRVFCFKQLVPLLCRMSQQQSVSRSC